MCSPRARCRPKNSATVVGTEKPHDFVVRVRARLLLVARGELKPRRIGRRILFERREPERFARRDHPIKPASADDGQMGVRPGRSTGRGT